MAKVLYLPSTPLNVLVCAAVANARKDFEQAEVWLIDQKTVEENVYLQALQTWQNSPFDKVFALSGAAKGKAKIAQRKTNFAWLAEQLERLQPEIIAVGSDRRVEFQFAMNFMRQKGKPAEGWYLDDGLYSYAGRPHHWLKDGINSLAKKLTYGSWWQEPKTVGASNWINQAWLYQPQQAHKLLKNKRLQKLETELFAADGLQEFGQLVTKQFGFDGGQLADIDVMLIISHPNNQLKMQKYAERVQKFVQQLTEQGKKVAIKYHPRQPGKDDLNLLIADSVVLIPAELAFEFILPFLPAGAQIIGDVGTVLLTAKWLREDLKPIAILNERDEFQKRFVDLIQSFDVEVYSEFNLLGLL